MRLRRFCIKEITSLAALGVLTLLAAALARNSVDWWASRAPCAARGCDECARAHQCVWCSGPAVAGSSQLAMPGLLRSGRPNWREACSTGLDAAACAMRAQRRNRVARRANVSSSASCRDRAGCVWYDTHHSAFRPAESACASAASPSLKHANGLTAETPACGSGCG